MEKDSELSMAIMAPFGVSTLIGILRNSCPAAVTILSEFGTVKQVG